MVLERRRMSTSEAEVDMPLREFLQNGLWPIEMPAPDDAPDSGAPQLDRLFRGMRPPSEQTFAVWRVTGGHVCVSRDHTRENLCADVLDSYLKLDESVPPDLHEAYLSATHSARFFGPLTDEADLHRALSHVYALVNRIVVDPTLRRNPANAHLWTTWNLEGDTTYLAAGLAKKTSTAWTADGACIAHHGPEVRATATLETKLASLFGNYQRVSFNDILSSCGFEVYLSYASNRLRAWNCPMVDGAASFWIIVCAQVWESMHVYKADRLILTSWLFTVLLQRTGRNTITSSFPMRWGPPPPDWSDWNGKRAAAGEKEREYINLFQVLLAAALFDLDEAPDRLWTEFEGMPPTMPASNVPLESPDAPPTVPTALSGWEKENAESQPAQAHFIQTFPEDDDTLGHFLELDAHVLALGPVLARGQVYTTFGVEATTFIPASRGAPRVVAKVVNLSALPYTDTKWSLSRAAIQRQVREEAALYCGPLAELQGTTVPRFYGLFEGYIDTARRVGVMIMLLEDVGEIIARSCVELERSVCTEIITAYESLHAAHVVHGDTGVQRIRRAADGTLRLVGFENAWAVDPAKPREMADVHDEYRCVLREYGFDVPEELSELVPPWEMEEEE